MWFVVLLLQFVAWTVVSIRLTETTISESYREFITQLIHYRRKPNGIVV